MFGHVSLSDSRRIRLAATSTIKLFNKLFIISTAYLWDRTEYDSLLNEISVEVCARELGDESAQVALLDQLPGCYSVAVRACKHKSLCSQTSTFSCSDCLQISPPLCSHYLQTNSHSLPTARKQPSLLTFSDNRVDVNTSLIYAAAGRILTIYRVARPRASHCLADSPMSFTAHLILPAAPPG
jgi:hypothetical protein